MQALITAVSAALCQRAREMYNAEQVEAVVREHKKQWPPHLTKYTFEGRVVWLAACLNGGARQRETPPERILQTFKRRARVDWP